MLHTKISNKLCDFGLVYLLIITHMHACFKHCVIQIYPTIHVSPIFWIITLAVPSSIPYTITVEIERMLLHSTQVNTCRNVVRSHFQIWIKIQIFLNKYNHWQHISQISMQNNMDFLFCHIKIESCLTHTCRIMTEIRPHIHVLSDTIWHMLNNPDKSRWRHSLLLSLALQGSPTFYYDVLFCWGLVAKPTTSVKGQRKIVWTELHSICS